MKIYDRLFTEGRCNLILSRPLQNSNKINTFKQVVPDWSVGHYALRKDMDQFLFSKDIDLKAVNIYIAYYI